MSVVLAILNIIFIAILFLLLAILIVLLMVLFLPVSYNVALSYIDKKLTYNIKVYWLFRLISVNMLRSDTGEETITRIAWKRFSDENSDKPKGSKEKKEEQAQIKEKPKAKAVEEMEGHKAKKDSKPQEEGKKTKKQKKRSIIDNIKEFYNSYKEFRALIDFSAIFKEVKLLLKRLFKAIKPKIFNFDLEIGLETPDVTGMTIGAAYVIKTFINTGNYEIALRGNFEKEVLNLTTHIKGGIVLWFGLWPFIRLCFSKSIKPIRKIILGKLFKRRKNKGEK